MLAEHFKSQLASLREKALYRERDVQKALGADGLVHFGSNDYLSFSTDPVIKKAYQTGFQRYAAGSGGSMVVCGYHETHQALERAFSEALRVDDCLLFSSGYAANVSVAHLLAAFKAHVLIDKGIHASVYDGLRGAGVRYRRYVHHTMADLRKKMATSESPGVVMTESVFSMSGQCSDLQQMSSLCKQYQHDFIVDEAHAFGVMGEEGLGAVVQHQLTQNEVPLRIIPLGKAYGAFGAIVAGLGLWIDALLQTARPYIYSTAMSPAYAYGLLETLTHLRQADDRRVKLQQLVCYFRESIKTSPLTWADSSSPIQQLQLGCPKLSLDYAKRLRQAGIVVLPMREPTVSKQATGLRIILNAHHEPAHIDALFSCLDTI